MTDANGVAIALNDTVSLTGTVIGLNATDTHYQEVVIKLAHPVAGVPNAENAGFPATPQNGGQLNGPGAETIIRVAAKALTH